MTGRSKSPINGEALFDIDMVSKELAASALETQGIDVKSPGYHNARFAAVAAVRLTIVYMAQSPLKPVAAEAQDAVREEFITALSEGE